MAGERALEQLARTLGKLRAASEAERMRASSARLGELFQRAAADVPDMFAMGPSFADTAEGLAHQFRTSRPTLIRTEEGALRPYFGADDYWISPHAMAKPSEDQGALLATVLPLHQLLNTDMQVLNQAGKLNPRYAYHMFDTTGLNSAKGEGQRVYATAFGNLRNLGPDHINFSNGLSPDNALRRSYNQASAFLRDPALAEQLVVGGSQLQHVPMKLREFEALSPTEKIGALQLSAAHGALNALKDSIERSQLATAGYRYGQAQRHMQNMDFATPAVLDRALEDNAIPYGALARAYQTAPSVPLPLGERSLRKLTIVNDALRGASFEDLAGRFPGLEYARGGSV